MFFVKKIFWMWPHRKKLQGIDLTITLANFVLLVISRSGKVSLKTRITLPNVRAMASTQWNHMGFIVLSTWESCVLCCQHWFFQEMEEKMSLSFANKALNLLLQHNCSAPQKVRSNNPLYFDTTYQTNSFKMKGFLIEFVGLQQYLFCLFIYPERWHCASSLKITICI